MEEGDTDRADITEGISIKEAEDLEGNIMDTLEDRAEEGIEVEEVDVEEEAEVRKERALSKQTSTCFTENPASKVAIIEAEAT